MQFTQLPQPFAPLDREVRYTLRTDTPQTLIIRIRNASDGTLLGAKRFVSVTQAAFDAAPYLRRALRFTPTTGRTGFVAADGRTVTATVEAQAEEEASPATLPTSAGTVPASGNKPASTDRPPYGPSDPGQSDPHFPVAEHEPAPASIRPETPQSVSTETGPEPSPAPLPESGGETGPIPALSGSESGRSDSSEFRGTPQVLPTPSESPATPEVFRTLPKRSRSSDTAGMPYESPAPETAAGIPAAPEASGTALSGFAPASNAATSSATAPVRTFLAAPATAPALATILPRERLIAPDEAEELTLLTDGPCTVTVTARRGRTAAAKSYRSEEPGPHLFRLDLRDFPETETLSVDAGACGRIDYTVHPPYPEGCRLAWRSEAGSIEHYTFPVVQRIARQVEKHRIRRSDGISVRTTDDERRIVLRSALETRTMLAALSGLIRSESVWIVRGERYLPVDVVTPAVDIRRRNEPAVLELEIRLGTETRNP